MPTGPEEYRAYARRCAELAAESIDPKLKKLFSELAKAWTQLASEAERSRALMKHSSSEP
jgi:hypothetical protein